MKYILSALIVSAGFNMPSANAQTEPASAAQTSPADSVPPDGEGRLNNFIALGIGAAPKYPGSDKYSPIPFIAGDFTAHGIEISVRGPSVRADMLGGRSRISVGPVAIVSFGRKPSDGGVARNLTRIGNEVDVGGFAAYRLGGNRVGQGEVEFSVVAQQDVSGVSKGTTVAAGVSYVVLRNERWNIAADTSATYASGKTMRTYFGVTAPEALASGLAPYTPKSGIRDIGVGLNIGYQIDRRWGVLTRVSYNDLIGDAAKSPIVKAGSRNQFLGGVALSYRF